MVMTPSQMDPKRSEELTLVLLLDLDDATAGDSCVEQALERRVVGLLQLRSVLLSLRRLGGFKGFVLRQCSLFCKYAFPLGCVAVSASDEIQAQPRVPPHQAYRFEVC